LTQLRHNQVLQHLLLRSFSHLEAARQLRQLRGVLRSLRSRRKGCWDMCVECLGIVGGVKCGGAWMGGCTIASGVGVLQRSPVKAVRAAGVCCDSGLAWFVCYLTLVRDRRLRLTTHLDIWMHFASPATPVGVCACH
jgi:hypothetical protein